MVYSDTTLSQGLVQDIDSLCGTNATDYPVADKTRNVNRNYDDVVGLILASDNMWEWDDTNQTNLPIGTASLKASQQDYGIDTTFLKILRVECKNSSGNWVQLEQFTPDQKRGTALTEFLKTAGTPQYFDLMANSIFLYPKPSYDSSGGLKVYFQRNVDYFVAGDTTQEPGFASPFHRLLSLGASWDYCFAKSITIKLPSLEKKIDKLEARLVNFYSQRDRDMKISMRLKSEDYGQEDYQGDKSVDWGTN